MVDKSHLAHGSERCLRQVPTILTIDNQLSSHEFMSNLTGRINRECMLKKKEFDGDVLIEFQRKSGEENIVI